MVAHGGCYGDGAASFFFSDLMCGGSNICSQGRASMANDDLWWLQVRSGGSRMVQMQWWLVKHGGWCTCCVNGGRHGGASQSMLTRGTAVQMEAQNSQGRCCCNGEDGGAVLPWWCKCELMEVLVARGGQKTCCRQGWRLPW
ncbi:hypothetical protein DEO72_LG1g2119 [Vigna unguiculata]|uniref:Uncharacterized protein n=1 Tax=Vigna unguiculata TaxID=3917 RepID=A0A4D6KKG0_VIGUN|nr:hypothetical protein DEO72_LG1g2119 [Vigna unguiculata]